MWRAGSKGTGEDDQMEKGIVDGGNEDEVEGQKGKDDLKGKAKNARSCEISYNLERR
jgi:hypothetical protein